MHNTAKKKEMTKTSCARYTILSPNPIPSTKLPYPIEIQS